MQKVGSNAGNSINVAVSNPAIGKVKERSDQTLNRSEQDYGSSRSEQDYSRSSEQDYDRSRDYRRQAEHPDAGDRGNGYDDRPPAETRDVQGRDNVSERGSNAKDEGRAARTDDANNGQGSDARSDKQEDVSKKSGNDTAEPEQTTNDKANNQESAKGKESADKNETSSKKVTKSGSEDAAAVAAANPVVVANVAAIANIAVSANDVGKIPETQKKSSLADQSAGNDKGNVAGQILGRDISKAKVKGKTKNSGAKVSNNVATNVGTKSNGATPASVKAADSAKANGKANSALKDLAMSGSDVDSNFKSRLAQQAAGISKAVGKGDQLKVSVNVAKESDTIVSKPLSTLVSQLSTGNKNNKQSGNSKSSTSTGKNAVNQASQQIKGGTAQGLDQQAKPQVSKFQSEVGGQGKGPAQSTVQSGTNSQPAISGGGESQSIAGPGGAAEPGQAKQSVAAKTATPKQANLARQPVINQVSVQITKAIAAGVDKINIQLKPNSLGRIEVNLEIAKNGHVSAVVVADNKNTLDLLQNGSDELKQALQNAGLDTDSGSLNFGLREENHTADGGNGGTGLSADNSGLAGGDDDNAETGSLVSRDVNIITDNRVDVRA